jgi:diadenosine tetraphosphate (Ap4A) HIT family hydrolase
MTNFQLNETLAKDSHFVAQLKLCEVRIINNSNFPWLILVPHRQDIIEITDLTKEDYLLLNEEILFTSKLIKTIFAPDKLNIATLGNVITQMHIHIIARYKQDKLFPKPVWGDSFEPYNEETLKTIINKLITVINKDKN